MRVFQGEETVLQAAVEKGQQKMLKFLLEQAADQINKTLAVRILSFNG